MAEERIVRFAPRPPDDWSQALSALPLETPPEGGWDAIAATLRSRPQRRSRIPAGFALAAGMAAIALVSQAWRLRPDAVPASPPMATQQQTATTRAPAVAAVAGHPADRIARDPGSADTTSPTVPEPRLADVARRPKPTIESGPAATGTVSTPTGEAQQKERIARASEQRPAPPARATASTELERLYAASTQLESLLALVRDERVASGTAVALAGDFDAQVAGIDAALAQPDLVADARIQLWRERVDALRRAAAFQSTQRLLAAQGERYDVSLVSVD